MKILRTAVVILAIAVALAIVASGFGARFGAWDFRIGFAILKYGAYAGFAVVAVALVMLVVPRTRSGNVAALAVALVVALGAAAVPLYWLQQARTLPPINDITTDLVDPPQFIAIVPLRVGSSVSAAYGGEATAKAQRAGYPDIAPIVLKESPTKAFAAARAVARDMGWTIVAADAEAGRIEATATTAWFGFHGDIVIRVAATPDGSRVDIRSHSRIGRSDLGANARRIREFTRRLTGA